MTAPFKKPMNPVAVVSVVVVSITLVGLGLSLMNVRNNIAAFAGLALVVTGIGLAGATVYSYFKEKNDQ